MNNEPEIVLDDEHELVIERVAAIDVAKASGKVCMRMPHPSRPDRRMSKVRDVDATTRAVTELADDLLGEGIERVTVESTSDYWRIWFYLLEAAGLRVQLVNARDVKNVPGRPKTDKLDAVWLAKLTEKSLLRPSFVPPAPIRQLRDYTRFRVDLTRERARYWQRMEKLLEDALIKVSAVVSRMDSMSVRDMLEALIAGERDPRRLAGLARGKMRPKYNALVEALSGRFDEHHAELARMLLDQIDALGAQISTLTTRIDELLAALIDTPGPAADGSVRDRDGEVELMVTGLDAAERLAEITGIGPVSAQVIIAEIGLDMARFPTAAHLVSWAKLSPRTIQSGAIQRSGKAGNLPEGRARRGRRGRRPHRHLPRRTLPAHRQASRQTQGPGRRRALHPRHRVESAQRPDGALPRPRPGLLHPPHRHRTKGAQPPRPTGRARLPGHRRARRLTTSFRHTMIRLRCAGANAVACHSDWVFTGQE